MRGLNESYQTTYGRIYYGSPTDGRSLTEKVTRPLLKELNCLLKRLTKRHTGWPIEVYRSSPGVKLRAHQMVDLPNRIPEN
jgi:hypothetical protein